MSVVARGIKVKNGPGEAIPVYLTESTASDELSVFGDVTSVASGTPTVVVTYTVPGGKTLLLKEIEVGGNNVATYTVEIASSVEAKKRTYFTHYNENFNWHGLEISAGDTIDVKVEHTRPSVGDFEARIIGSEI